MYLLRSRGKIKSTLTGFYAPQGLAVDKADNLYPADARHVKLA